jgi:hypothetical protein
MTDMPQPPLGEVCLACEGVVQTACAVDRHGVDGEVAPHQVVFEPHVGAGMKDKPFVAMARLTLGTGQRVFGLCVGVKKDRKVLAHRPKAGAHHGRRGGAYHQIVSVLAWQAKQGITHGTAHAVDGNFGRQSPYDGIIPSIRGKKGGNRGQ